MAIWLKLQSYKMFFDLHTHLQNPTKYSKFLRHDILFDNGPLFLYLIGNFDYKNGTDILKSFNYTKEDFDILFKLIHLLKKSHKSFVITPHILHELIKHTQDECKKKFTGDYCLKIKKDISEFIRPILEEIKEIPTEKNKIINHNHFLGRLEIGDISIDIIDKIENECSIILTDDSKFIEDYGTADNEEVLLIYFTNVRDNAPLLTGI